MYFNYFYYLTVAHKGFPTYQNVVDAISEICGRLEDGAELRFYQKEDFLRFIRGESDNSYNDFSLFWFITLTLYEYLLDISVSNLLRRNIYQFIFTIFFCWLC